MPSVGLKPGEMLVTLATSAEAGINGIGILSGAVLVTYDNQMGYNTGDNISFRNNTSFQFTEGVDVYSVYSLVNQKDVLFKIITPP